jgi:hypothetical protein
MIQSDDGSTRIHVQWKLVELWQIPAADLLAAGDIGLIPWVPLAQFNGPPEPIFRACRDRIEREPDPKERESLRVVTHFLAGLKYNDPRLFQLLGGKEAMFKTGSPVLQKIINDAERRATEVAVLTVLVARFGVEAETLKSELEAIGNVRLKKLLGIAGTCSDLDSFREQLAPRRRKRGT